MSRILASYERHAKKSARFGADPVAPVAPVAPATPEGRAAKGFLEWVNETTNAVDVKFTGGFDFKGQRYANVTVAVPNPNLFLQGAASQALQAAGVEGVAVQANIGAQDQTVSFTFSVGAEPKTP